MSQSSRTVELAKPDDLPRLFEVWESSVGATHAFLGVAGAKIEMLFMHADHRGSGAGRLLSEFAIRMLNVDSVDVNEGNEQAIGFYLHLGFRQVSRSRMDATGRPFRILHLALEHPSSRRPLLSQLSVASCGT